MDLRRIQSHLAALGLERAQAPDAAAWRQFLARVEADSGDAALLRRERYLEAVVEMQSRLLSTPSDQLGAFNHALAPLGEAAGASRVYLFENHSGADGTRQTSQRAEWCAPGVTPEIDNPDLQGLSYDDFLPRWAAVMGAGQRVEKLHTEFDELERELLGPQGILSILVIPLMVDGAFTGFIGFDNCASATRWGKIDVQLLSAAATQIGLVLAQRRAQRRLQAANAEVTEARDRAVEATQAKSVFLAKISHELRTPLNAILGYTELLLEAEEDDAIDLVDDAQRHLDLERIYRSSRHLLNVINDLLDLSRAEADRVVLRREVIDLDALLSDLLSATRHLARRQGNTLTAAIPDALGSLVSDRTRVHQILLNLLSNACKYTFDGTIRLVVRALEETVEFAVEDTGIGIDAAHLERIFDAFTQADDAPTRSFEGTGLGLTISRHLCRLLGGELLVASAPGRGSTFTFVLPRQPPAPR
ncbi:MAG: GAF domain-containing sensor histidine kinase [Nannocystaceae bacterium]